jgi:hypothetical protein
MTAFELWMKIDYMCGHCMNSYTCESYCALILKIIDKCELETDK